MSRAKSRIGIWNAPRVHETKHPESHFRHTKFAHASPRPVRRPDKRGKLRQSTHLAVLTVEVYNHLTSPTGGRLMAIEPLAVGVCSWSLQVSSIPELRGSWISSGVNVVQSPAVILIMPVGRG